MNYLSLNELIEKRKEEILIGNYSYNFYNQMCRNWKQLLDFLQKNNLSYDDNSKQLYLDYQKNNKSHKDYLYTIHSINALEGLNALKLKTKSSRIINNHYEINISNYNKEILEKYKQEMKNYNSEVTITKKIKLTKDIMVFFENESIDNYEKLTLSVIQKFINKYYDSSYYIRKNYNWALKMFLNFLYESKYTISNYSVLIDKIKYHAPISLVTIWEPEELEKIVNNLVDESDVEKRNKAIVLLAIRLGIRFIDIKNLQFSNIDWENNTITFIHHKTKVEIQLPLFEDVGIAIINYVQNGRPKTDSKYIFVTHDDKASKLSDTANIEKYLIKTYQKANIDYLSKARKGIHTFRHTLASSMLKANIPMEIIASTLGHVNIESTRNYLKIDTNSLKKCFLEDDTNE